MLILPPLIEHCVPQSVRAPMQAIVQVESKGNPLAINLNKGYKLQLQPKSKAQALKWVEYLEQNNYDFDIGLAQVNVKNAHKYGYKPSKLLEPCTNLKVGSSILANNYTKALPESKSTAEALKKAISAYNTGNFHSGFNNGYVNLVYAVTNNNTINSNSDPDIPPIIDKNAHDDKAPIAATPNYTTRYMTASSPYSSRSLLYIQQKKPTPEELDSINGAKHAPTN